AYIRAKAFENAYKQNPTQAAYATPTVFHSPYSFPSTPNLNFASSNETAEALKSLTSSIDKLINQFQDQRRPLSRPRSGNSTPSTVTCFTCGRTGHYSRNCPDSLNNRNNPPVNNRPPTTNNNNSTPNGNDPQETLQALLALMNNNPGLFNNVGNQASYLGIPDDET
ncbi:10873_t:CDS:1, partial [Ambispora leptoticha]